MQPVLNITQISNFLFKTSSRDIDASELEDTIQTQVLNLDFSKKLKDDHKMQEFELYSQL